MRVLAVWNPVANRGRSRGVAAELQSLSSDEKLRGVHWEWVESNEAGHAVRVAEGAQGYDVVVACGGDGTVHEVVNGLMRFDVEARPTLGVLPVGSGNDFAFALGIPKDPKAAVRKITDGNLSRVDIGKLTDDSGRVEWWDNTTGIGFDTNITLQSKKITRVYGFAMYALATAQTILRHYETMPCQLTIDGVSLDRDLIMLACGNGPREGGGFYVTPQAKMHDGILDYLMVEGVSRPEILRALPKLMSGKPLTQRGTSYGTFQSLELKSTTPLRIHTDGEVFSDGTGAVHGVTIEVRAGALNVAA